MNLDARMFAPRTVAPLLAALALVSCAGFGGSRVRTPEVAVVNVLSGEMEGLETTAQVVLRLTNPNEFPVEIDGLRVELEVNHRRFARGQTDQIIQLPRLGDARATLAVRTGLGDVLRQIAGPEGNFSYRITGELFMKSPQKRVLRFGYAFEQPG